jgi:hypothetical protein
MMLGLIGVSLSGCIVSYKAWTFDFATNIYILFYRLKYLHLGEEKKHEKEYF